MSTSNPRPTATRQAIEAHFAEQAYHQSTSNPDHEYILHGYNSDRARNCAVSKKLIVLYMEKFKMDARQAREEVEREMGEKYASNPWDARTPTKYEPRRSPSKTPGKGVTEASQVGKSTKYSEEQWDLFEKSLK